MVFNLALELNLNIPKYCDIDSITSDTTFTSFSSNTSNGRANEPIEANEAEFVPLLIEFKYTKILRYRFNYFRYYFYFI